MLVNMIHALHVISQFSKQSYEVGYYYSNYSRWGKLGLRSHILLHYKLSIALSNDTLLSLIIIFGLAPAL